MKQPGGTRLQTALQVLQDPADELLDVARPVPPGRAPLHCTTRTALMSIELNHRTRTGLQTHGGVGTEPSWSPSARGPASVSPASVSIFLDYYHGTPISFKNKHDSFYHTWGSYITSLIICLYWLFSIPYSRYLGGAHSLDQVVYGSSLGICLALFCHFMIRDHLIIFFEKAILW